MRIISDLVRTPRGRAAERLAEVGDSDIAISVIVAGELRYGCLKAGSPRLTERVEAVLREIVVLSLKPEVGARYGEIRRDLEARGMPIGFGCHDLRAASYALRKFVEARQ